MGTVANAKLTIASLKTLSRRSIVWDSDVKGFGARGIKGGATFIVFKWVNGRKRLFTIGRFGSPWTIDAARKEAMRIVAQGYHGVDEKEVREKRLIDGVLFADVVEKFLQSHGNRIKPGTLENYRRLFRLHLNPAFGTKPLASLDPASVMKFHDGMASQPRNANHALACLSKMISWSKQKGYWNKTTPNPCAEIEHFKEKKRNRFITDEEAGRLGAVLLEALNDGSEDPYVVGLIWFLIYTGARRGEGLSLKWDFVDLARRFVHLPDSKTDEKTFLLNDYAIQVLRSMKRVDGNPYVFVGKRSGKALVNVSKPWKRITQRAQLADFRIHDIRHSFGNMATDTGGTTKVLGRQLGHSSTATTDRYAHVGDRALRQLVDITGNALHRAFRQDQMCTSLSTRLKKIRRVPHWPRYHVTKPLTDP